MALNAEILETIRQEITTAPHGFRGELVSRRAEMYGMTPQTLYRHLNLNARERRKDPRRPELREWAKIVAMLKKRPPEEAGEVSTDQAMRAAVEAGHCPPELLDVHPATIDRVMREIGTTKKMVRATRFQAKLPNQAHHFDGSTSNYFHIARQMPDGEYILMMHRPAAGGYKNKPIPCDRLRLVYYGLVDDHSGRRIADVIPAPGENAQDSMLMLERFWREFGLSKRLLIDQGMLKKCKASSRWLDLVGIEIPEMMPYAKRGHGKVENPWKTFWQRWEKPFYMMDNWQKYEITLTEFRRRLKNHIEEMNAKPHRFERNISRMDAWRRVMLNGGITVLPKNSLAAAARETKRKVDVDGMLEYKGGLYEVKGLHDAWVMVYEGIFTDKLVVMDIETKQRYEVRDFQPVDEGEYKNYDDTPHEKAVKAGAELHIPESALPYGDTVASVHSNVVQMPIRKTEREVASMFDLDSYATVEEAMEELCGIVGTFIADSERAALAELVEANGRSRQYVRELAMEIRGAVEQQRRAQ